MVEASNCLAALLLELLLAFIVLGGWRAAGSLEQ